MFYNLLQVFIEIALFSLVVVLFKPFARFWGFEKMDKKSIEVKEICGEELVIKAPVEEKAFKFSFFKNIPKDNFHIYSYISLCFLAYCVWPYNSPEEGFYLLLRLMITTLAGLVIYKEFQINQQSKWIVVFGIIALIFNPIKMVTFSDWLFVDFITFCLISLYLFKDFKNNSLCNK